MTVESELMVVVDADGHVCEPPDLWERNLPPSMRERGLRVRWNDEIETQQVLVEDDVGIPMGLAGLTNAGMHNNENFAQRDALRGRQPRRLRRARRACTVLDEEGIDIAVLYCGLGQALGGIQDPQLAVACHQVWNDWMAEWASAVPDRLVGSAVIPAHDPDGRGAPRSIARRAWACARAWCGRTRCSVARCGRTTSTRCTTRSRSTASRSACTARGSTTWKERRSA